MFAETPERATGACRPYVGKPREVVPAAQQGCRSLKEGEWQQGPKTHPDIAPVARRIVESAL